MIRVGIFNCPRVKKNDIVEIVHDCESVNSNFYNYRVICKVYYVENNQILVELPSNYKKIGTIHGWFGKEYYDQVNFTLKPEGLYWWVETWRLLKNRILDIE